MGNHITQGKRCKSCQQCAEGNYCSNCGQLMQVQRITFSSLLHDVFQFFTNIDKGFLFTLKMLLLQPGTMQLEYIDGSRSKHQKPFSMFLICATFFGLSLYWINIILDKVSHAGDMAEAQFFDKYIVLMLICIVPLTTLINYLFFLRSRFNFAEIGVLTLYTISFVLLIVVVANSVKFLIPGFHTRYIEVPFVILYSSITFINFFKDQKRWIVLIKSILSAGLFFSIAALTQDALVSKI